ncbi:gliding motility-associated C-terminal domain-containing protein [Galbibacter pacificus]|uniref:Gliding motility-associated C-terminal domain-containing protein n=1 Tax=Galbibacter pacificus TaxID=2996052 RepID=A0ABT6FWK1_9FLAO|nr:gliding motility-associated C-terminal domain-containing protein [Galbibacter pacificus]MDG3584174.1 gliding motility-associated C-terminal domain-containing protein [Galbibacter pacificus]MDG3587645.1 gliding motility-associated C-terminal domain-containing protein [Galbibacter pacificus]
MNRTLHQKSIRLCLLSMLIGVATVYSQDLKKPILGFSDACASKDYNSFTVEFKWDPNPIVESDNKFVLELSNANGSFSSPTTLATISDKNTVFDFDVEFNMPQDVRGENYKVRIRSTNPAKTSPASDPFGAYYLNVTEPLVVNNFEEASVCEAATVYLEVDNYPNEASYNWYKDMAMIPGKHESSIEVTEPGIYFAEIDYGSYCSTSTASNLVEVYIENSLGAELIGAKKVSLCQDQTYTLTTDLDDPSMTYGWYKDGELLEKNHSNTLVVNGSDPGFAGDYYVELEQPGGCKEKTSTVKIEAGGFDLSLEALGGTVLLPQQTLTLQTSTTAVSASYQWYRNGQLLADESADKLVVGVPGDYYVKVSQTDGCIASKTSDAITIVEPSDYVAYVSSSNYSDCNNSSVTISLDKIEANATSEEVYNIPQSAWNGFSYQWVYNGNPLTGEASKSIEVSSPENNGKYALVVTMENGKRVTSEAFNVKLGLHISPQITGNRNVACDSGNTIEITSTVTDEKYTYTWYRNNVELTENTPNFATNLSGTYQLKVSAYGCSVASNEFVINPFDASMVTIDAPETIAVPEGETKTVTASGGDAYQWFNTKNELISNGPSVTLSEEGEYTLLASVGECQATNTVKFTNLVSYVVPNVITPNGDGFNDLWIIPNSYAYQKDVTVNIYEQSGAPIYRASAYQNNWPESSSIMYTGGRPPIYYYKITKGKETLKQGTITVIK